MSLVLASFWSVNRTREQDVRIYTSILTIAKERLGSVRFHYTIVKSL